MAGTVITGVLVVICTVLSINCASARPQDALFPSTIENAVEHLESQIYPHSVNTEVLKAEEKPKNCFHFFVSRNMSSLLADATKMLRTIRDRREREWILTFIYRIKSLAEHLRSHPESRNYDCLPTDDESKKKIFNNDLRGQQQPELYFVDDLPKRSNDGEVQQEKTEDKYSNDNQESTKASEEQPTTIITPKDKTDSLVVDKAFPAPESQEENSSEASKDESRSPEDEKQISVSKKQDVIISSQIRKEPKSEEVGMPQATMHDVDSSIVLSSSPDCESTTECQNIRLTSSPEQVPENFFGDGEDIYPMYQAGDSKQDVNAELYLQELLKLRIRKALLEELGPEIKKLRTVGGTEEDLMRLWNLNVPEVQEDKPVDDGEADFDYEETGAAAGDLNMNEKIQPDRTVAPSLDEVQSSKENANNIKESPYQPYDDSDVLVQQLFDVRYNDPPSKTTKSLNDQNNEYLITSTHIPF